MKIIILALLTLLPLTSHARFLFQYGLNYSSEKDDSANDGYEKTRTFHKAFLGASVNGRKTLFFGWNINSWSSAITQGDAAENSYSLLEMGPRLVWFTSDSHNLYFSAEWNPYVRGDREKANVSREIQGSSMAFGVGYRFKISRLFGLGAGIHYHSVSLNEEKIESTESNISDSISHLMPMLELTIITR